MSHAYTENHGANRLSLTRPLPAGEEVDQPTIGWFAEFSSQAAVESAEAGLLVREINGEVMLVGLLRAAPKKLNPPLPPEAMDAKRIRASDPGAANKLMR